jgi:hypothetical protein
MAHNPVVQIVEQPRLVALEERTRLFTQNAAKIGVDVGADVRDAFDDLSGLDSWVRMRKHDVRNVGHDRGSKAERARLDSGEEDAALVVVPKRVAAMLQRLELRVRELRKPLALPRTPPRDDTAVDDEHCSNRILAVPAGPVCFRKRLAHHRLEIQGSDYWIHGGE